ncbi:MAG: hypothetical protein K9N10_21745 [Deltaproteobacteria bacterium]|nr:hypothetical protein [Deltaproteobacteria bacterium]
MYSNSIGTTPETVRYGVTGKLDLYAGADLFARVLDKTLKSGSNHLTGSTSRATSLEIGNDRNSNRVKIGTISEQNPSVSSLLRKHPLYGKDCWEIVHAASNQNKSFTKMKEGVSVYLNRKTSEIFWCNAPSDELEISNFNRGPVGAATNGSFQIFLGNLSKKMPTVSHLLSDHPVYGKECWSILTNDLNGSKEFRSIPNHAAIYLNRHTGEITWTQEKKVDVAVLPESPAKSAKAAGKVIRSVTPEKQTAETDAFSEKLARAVKPYTGTSYYKMNCFELLVKGLEKVGIQYRGPGGLGNRLIRKALAKGLPENHYLSGEGLIETAGTLVYSKSFTKIKRPAKEAQALYKEIKPLLRKGQILSFSTLSRGHTGVVFKRGNRWTYINSGNMDHIISGRRKKGVGEESLKPEIANWVRLASNSGETLSVTIGSLNEQKLKGSTALLNAKAEENKV